MDKKNGRKSGSGNREYARNVYFWIKWEGGLIMEKKNGRKNGSGNREYA